jgi:hypothetical protein
MPRWTRYVYESVPTTALLFARRQDRFEPERLGAGLCTTTSRCEHEVAAALALVDALGVATVEMLSAIHSQKA